MAALVLRLRFSLLLGALRGDRTRVVRTVLALLLTAAATVVACVAVVSLSHRQIDAAETVVVLGGGSVVLGYFLAPVFAGTIDQLDPRRFVVFGLDRRWLPAVLALAGTISVPTLALLAVEIAVLVTAIGVGSPWILAVLGAILTTVTATLGARVGMALSAMLLPERRSRELTALFALAVIVIAVPVGVFVASMQWDHAVPEVLHGTAVVLGFTPFGAAAAFPFHAAEGDTAAAVISGLVALATVIGLGAAWTALVRRALTHADRPTTVRERPGLGWFALLPSNAFGAIAARSLVYWLRDRRYLVNIVIVPIAGVLTVFPLLVAGVPLSVAVTLPVAVMALFFGWLPHNDVAYDSTAFWTHVASGVRGLPDRLGRLVPVVLVAVPTLAVAIPVTLAIIGRWSLAPVLMGIVLCLFLSGLGLSSIVSVLVPYAVSRPGDSPFQQPQRSSSPGSLGPALALVGTAVVSLPALLLGWNALNDPSASVMTPFWVGLGIGVVVLVAGVLLGAQAFERSGERLMEFVETV